MTGLGWDWRRSFCACSRRSLDSRSDSRALSIGSNPCVMAQISFLHSSPPTASLPLLGSGATLLACCVGSSLPSPAAPTLCFCFCGCTVVLPCTALQVVTLLLLLLLLRMLLDGVSLMIRRSRRMSTPQSVLLWRCAHPSATGSCSLFVGALEAGADLVSMEATAGPEGNGDDGADGGGGDGGCCRDRGCGEDDSKVGDVAPAVKGDAVALTAVSGDTGAEKTRGT